MASESNFIDFGDLFIDADLYAGFYPPCDLNFFALEDGPNFHGIFGPTLPLQVPHSTGEFLPDFFPEMPPGTSSTPGVTQNAFHSFQTSHETPILQPRTTVAPPSNAFLTSYHNETTGAESQSTDITSPHSDVLPLSPLPTPSSSPVTTIPPNWIKVPQRTYDHGRRQLDFESSEPIPFSVNGRLGINIGAALRKEFTGLDGRDDPVLHEAAGAISCRLLFPGYPANSRPCQIHTLGWTKDRLPITRSKLAHEVAKRVEQYLNYITNFPLNESVEGRWKVGEGIMRPDNIFLVRLVSVSKGSFQPEIWVAGPSAPRVLAGWE